MKTHRKAVAAPDYDRARDLPRLVPVWPSEIADHSASGTLSLIARLRHALRGERVRGRAGHWTYDLNRHLGLAKALRAEEAAIARIASGPRTVD